MTEQTFVLVASVANNAIVNPINPDEGVFEDAFERGNSSILVFDAATGKFISEVVPPGTAEENVSVASGISFGPNGLLYALDQGNNSVKRYDLLTGNFIDTFIESDSIGLDSTLLVRPEGIQFDPSTNDLIISNLAGGGVLRFSSTTGELLETIATTNPDNEPLAAAGLIFDPEGDLYIGSVFNDSRILRYDSETAEVTTFIPPEAAQPIPSFPVFGEDGRFYNGTFSSEAIGFPPTDIRVYDGETGELIEVFVEPGNNLEQSSRLRFSPLDDDLYVTSFGSNRVLRYDGETGAFIEEFISPGTGGLANPGGLAFVTLDVPSELVFGTSGNDNQFDSPAIIVTDEPVDSDIILPTPKLVFGGSGEDLIDAAVGNSTLPDRLYGGTGGDEIIAGTGDRLFGGDENDLLDASAGGGNNRLYGGRGNDELFANTGDRLFGGEDNDTLDASTGGGNNRLYGGKGDDLLLAGVNDVLVGGEDNDTLIVAGEGNNILTGGEGADIFRLVNVELPSQASTVTDFEAGVDLIGIGGLELTEADFGVAERLEVTAQGNDTLVTALGTDVGLLTGVDSATITVENFIFA